MSVLLSAALLAGCAEGSAPPAPLPEPVQASVAEDPAPPSVTLAERIRDEGWIVRFWEQLTPAQRRRVTKQLRNNVPRLASEEAEAAPIWDALGLPERDALIFGSGIRRASGP
ncbi:hypothetical protein [Falsiroseomonas oryzae]|uniref:hypothetical protein n=1 Tax=Falsiroseomonas oryzae TaxID=2766473 RepID=UPI0022EA3F3B|nr:hypothetical protein [Roseomonas sp. MO-31]